MQVIPLSEGTFTVDKTKQFVPFDENTDNLQARVSGSLLVEIQPFIVITSKDILLLDTGLGFSNNSGRMQIQKNTSTLVSQLKMQAEFSITLSSQTKRVSAHVQLCTTAMK